MCELGLGQLSRAIGCVFSCVRLFVTPWTVAHQSLSMGFPRQEYWSGLPFPSPRDLPNPGTEPVSPVLAGGFFNIEPPGKHVLYNKQVNKLDWPESSFRFFSIMLLYV